MLTLATSAVKYVISSFSYHIYTKNCYYLLASIGYDFPG